jgi:hypothetical protein
MPEADLRGDFRLLRLEIRADISNGGMLGHFRIVDARCEFRRIWCTTIAKPDLVLGLVSAAPLN